MAMAGLGQWPDALYAATGEETVLTILHTNDMHSRIDPFPADDKRDGGQGGMSQRAALIKSFRQTAQHVVLLDSGDIFQGTPYFNYFGGEPEFRLMSAMGYDAATMGNHDFDAGVEGFARQLPHADFPFLVSNYDFTNTALQGRTKDYTVVKRGRIRIGIFGLGIELHGLVPDTLFGETRYLEPVSIAQQMSNILRYDERCDVVICLSHLGYRYEENKVSDQILAKSTGGIDLILGGHTHTFMEKPEALSNKDGEEVLINQVGWAGLRLGHLELILNPVKRKKWRYETPVIVE